jgi:hypothetical protein
MEQSFHEEEGVIKEFSLAVSVIIAVIYVFEEL